MPGDRFTLRFAPELEGEFQREYFHKSVRAVRLVIGLGTLLYAAFFLVDYIFLSAELFTAVLGIRAVTVAFLLAIFAFTFSRHFARWWQLAVAAAVLAIATSVSLMLVVSSAADHIGLALAPSFLLYLMVTFTVARLRLPYAVVTALVLIALFNVVLTLTGGAASLRVVSNTLMLSAVVLGAAAAYLLERYIRSDWMHATLLDREREQLRQANELLERRNVELARSREQVMRASQRTELVFLALTDALPGATLDEKYRVEEKIGSGSFGTVYRGTHMQLDTPVAIKVLRPYQGQDDVGMLERLRQEGVSAWRLRHPNIVAVLDFSVASDVVAYLVMELLVGRSVEEDLRPGVPITLARTAEVMEPVCQALAEAHARGIIHRDVKPSNVFLHQTNGTETVKVIDFGIAKVLDADPLAADDRRTATGLLLGTPAYFAPERFDGRGYGGEVDVYAVGVMLYEMLTGALPFPKGAGDWTTALLRLSHQPVSLGNKGVDIPAELDELILRAISLEPRERPSAAELARALGSIRGAALTS